MLVTLSTLLLAILMVLTWIPVLLLLDKKQRWGSELCTQSPKGGNGDSNPRLETLIEAAEDYEKDLRSQRKSSYDKNDKMEIIGAILGMLRKW